MKIYLSLNNRETIFLKEVDSLSAAKEYIEDKVHDSMIVDDEHNCSDDVFQSSKVCQFEVYDNVVLNTDESFYELAYMSDYYYTDTISI